MLTYGYSHEYEYTHEYSGAPQHMRSYTKLVYSSRGLVVLSALAAKFEIVALLDFLDGRHEL